MDMNSQDILQELPQSTASSQAVACALCRRIPNPDNEVTGDLDTPSICGDCKFLFLEDLGTTAPDSYQRRPPRGIRSWYRRSESIENFFSQQFSSMINLERQNQSTVSGHEDQSIDNDVVVRLSQRTSSRTTPSGSRRWGRGLSDTESDGFDNSDSLYGESESNMSYGRYRFFHGDNDTISLSTFVGDSDASVDGHSFLDTDMFIQPHEGSDLDSDTDIDPMHTGLNQWDWDDPEGGDEDDEWEEADAEEDAVESAEARAQLTSPGERNGIVPWYRSFHSPNVEETVRRGITEVTHQYIRNMFANTEESELPPYIGNSGDYLDARGFEELLEHLAETDNSRRGAPPAAVSFVNNLPLVIITEEHEKHDSSACAICKDVLTVGTEVNQLPCLHLYHPSCIFPWLSTRNSCPICRFELPTDDKDYEEGKQNTSSRMHIREIQQQDESEDSSSDTSDEAEAHESHQFGQATIEQAELLDVDPAINSTNREGGRGRWFFLAAAPIVGLVGIVLVLWLGNPLIERRGPAGHCNSPQQGLHQINVSGSSQPNQGESRGRRWWSLF